MIVQVTNLHIFSHSQLQFLFPPIRGELSVNILPVTETDIYKHSYLKENGRNKKCMTVNGSYIQVGCIFATQRDSLESWFDPTIFGPEVRRSANLAMRAALFFVFVCSIYQSKIFNNKISDIIMYIYQHYCIWKLSAQMN